MMEKNSPEEKNKEISLQGVAIYPHLQSIIGEKYCSANRIVVLEDTPFEIKLAVPEQSLPCIDEVRNPPEKDRSQPGRSDGNRVDLCAGIRSV